MRTSETLKSAEGSPSNVERSLQSLRNVMRSIKRLRERTGDEGIQVGKQTGRVLPSRQYVVVQQRAKPNRM
jgi:hypothetical protein